MVALVLVADGRGWSGWQTLAAALGVGVFYVVTILVPWLIREQSTVAKPKMSPTEEIAKLQELLLEGEIRDFNGVWVVPLGDGNGGVHEPETYGPELVSPEPPLALRS
jgi:hypothetical protein